MDFHSYYAKKLNPTADGLRRECRAKDPDNCPKRHTGRYACRANTQTVGSEAKAYATKAQEPWKVFKLGNKELFAYTVRGESAEEEKKTKKSLADEIGCSPDEIDVLEERRPTVRGNVPGEKKDEIKTPRMPDKNDVDKIEKAAKTIAEALRTLFGGT